MEKCIAFIFSDCSFSIFSKSSILFFHSIAVKFVRSSVRSVGISKTAHRIALIFGTKLLREESDVFVFLKKILIRGL